MRTKKSFRMLSVGFLFGVGILVSSLSAQDQYTSFGDYWYRGKAEISSYHLEQVRYGEIHQGETVLIFVTEDFSSSQQVKSDNPTEEETIKVLKMNLTKNFITGVYPYSMMLSVFTPVDLANHPHTLKAVASSQEWCGQTFTQLNLKKENYNVHLYSYFQMEGDKKFSLEKTVLEDSLWNRIRLQPSQLPQGEIMIIPGSLAARLGHTPLQREKALASLSEDKTAKNLLVYSLDYPRLKRSLKIRFQKNFPHQIESWEETYVSGWGAQAKKLTTKATRKKTLLIDYWNKNRNVDKKWRSKLELD